MFDGYFSVADSHAMLVANPYARAATRASYNVDDDHCVNPQNTDCAVAICLPVGGIAALYHRTAFAEQLFLMFGSAMKADLCHHFP
jgi:hypothetical protein